MKRIFAIVSLLLICATSTFGQATSNASWIWFPGDYEIWLHKEMSLRRTERGGFYPPFWRLDTHHGAVKFSKQVRLDKPEKVEIRSTGRFNVQIDGKYMPENTTVFEVPAGRHSLTFDVVNYETIPSIFVKGETINSDDSWSVTYNNRQNHKAAQGDFNQIDELPTKFHFNFQKIDPIETNPVKNGLLVDFGKETFGYLQLKNIKDSGEVRICYGESKEEAMSVDLCETFDVATIPSDSSKSYTLPCSRALRYAQIIMPEEMEIESAAFITESLPLEERGSFKCSNEKMNKIWDVAAYTLNLTSREFMLDGIKRDRWVWSGDASQSYLMNYYLFFDQEINRRTIIALRGQDPVETPINHILDYSFYWLTSIYEYYLYTGDKSLIEMIYPKMLSMMEFCNTRLNKNNLVQGWSSDWVYLDWADIDTQGELSAYQVLYARSLEAMSACSKIMNDPENAEKYEKMADQIKDKLFDLFWNDQLHAFVHNRKNGEPINKVTRYSNMFAILYGYFNELQGKEVGTHVLMNDSIQKITTPYMRFYELAALCEINEYEYVTNEILDYWGGMLDLGATTFWEQYNPKETGTEHLAMYGRPFGRSLCHAWGASPIYLLGKFYLGVSPTSAGYQTWCCEPHLGGLEWIEGSVPTPNGDIKIKMDTKEIKITSNQPGGTLRFQSKTKPKTDDGELKTLENNWYEIQIDKTDKEFRIQYKQL